MICHGKGGADQVGRHPDGEAGCCHWGGHVCPNRWRIVWNGADGTIYDWQGVSLGLVSAYINSLMPGGGPTKTQRVNRVMDQVRNITYVCKIPAYLIGMDPSLINARTTLDAQWLAHADYDQVADYWESIGMPRNWCMTYGPPDGQCCFSESAATNLSKQSDLAVSAVTVRRSASGAS